MTESESKSHWQSLAAEIGAEIPNEPEPQLEDDQLSETASESRTDTPSENLETLKLEVSKPPKRTPPPAPVRPANHWSLLAGELGLEVPEEPEPIEPEPIEPAADTSIGEPTAVLNSDADEPKRVSPAADDDAIFESPPEFSPSDKPSEVQAGRTDVTTASESLADEFDEMSSEQSGDDLELPDEPVSVTGDADEQPDEGRKRRKRRGRRRRRRGEDANESPEETEAEPETIEVVTVGSSEPEEIEVVAVRDFEDEEDESDEEAEAESAEGKERRGRRRRRRRGARRPRERDEASSEDDKGTDTDEPSDSEDHEPESDDSEEDESGEERRTKHRKIPSWQEAVAGMIDSNVKNHASNENSGRRGRGKRGRSS